MNKFGIIVDGYSTGAGFAKEFLKYNIQCIHVQSQLNIPKVYFHTYIPTDYYTHYIFESNLDSLVQTLEKYKPQFVIAGAECGVEFADILCERLGLPGNNIELSAHRRYARCHSSLPISIVGRFKAS